MPCNLLSCEIASHLLLCHPTPLPTIHFCSLSSKTVKFLLSPPWEVPSFSFCFLLPLFLPNGTSLPVTSCLELSFTLGLPHPDDFWQDASATPLLQFLHCQEVLNLCIFYCFSDSLGLPRAVRYHGGPEAVSVQSSFCSPATPHPTFKARMLSFYTVMGKLFFRGQS